MIIKLYECFSYAHALRILFSPEAIMWSRYAVILMVQIRKQAQISHLPNRVTGIV